MERRLAAILTADVVDYTRMMAEDQRRALEVLRKLRGELLEPVTAKHNGNVVKRMGDGWIVEFPSISDAVTCAIEAQEGLVAHGSIRLRMGIHTGEVVFEAEDVFGDGVNVAARLEELAAPGQIAISDMAYNSLDRAMARRFAGGDSHDLKNVPRPVSVWFWPTIAIEKNIEPVLALPDNPSIVVLPFDIMSGDRDQEYFADGLTEDIITDLSRFPGLFVIARNTAFTYKGTNANVPEIARELGVHFVLEGSVRMMGERVRITAQLIDGIDGNHVWADRYDGMLQEIFELQEGVTRKIVANIAPQIDKAEMAHLSRGKGRFDKSHGLAWRSYAKLNQSMAAGDPQPLEQAIDFAKRALALNDKTNLAYILICWAYSMQNLYAWGDDPVGAADRAREYAEAAMKALPQSETAYICLGAARFRSGDAEQAVRDFRSAHELNPNDVRTLFMLAWAEATIGDSKAARRHVHEVLRLSPKDLWSQLGYLAMSMASFIDREHGDFMEWAQMAIQASPAAPIRRVMMISYAAEIEEKDLLNTHLTALNNFAPDFIASLFRGENRPFAQQDHMDLLLEGLRKAGLSE